MNGSSNNNSGGGNNTGGASSDPSIVDYLGGKGMDSSPEGRAALYESNGLGKASDYLAAYNSGNNADQNTALLGALRGKSNLITTSSDSRNQYNQNSAKLSQYQNALNPGSPAVGTPASGSNPAVPTLPTGNTPTPDTSDPNNPSFSDPYTQMLDRISNSSDNATKALISNINASRANQETTVSDQFDRYSRGLEALGIQSGESQYLPGIQAGLQVQSTNEKLAKIQSIESKELKAISDAQQAQSKNDLATFKDKMDYVEKLKSDKIAAIKEAHDAAIQPIEDATKYQDLADKVAPGLLQQISGMSSSNKEEAINNLATSLGMKDPSYLMNALANESAKAAKKAGTGKYNAAYENEIGGVLTTGVPGKFNGIGKDGYADPYLYVQAYNTVKSKYGDAAAFQFLTKFKPSTYLNPDVVKKNASKKLPGLTLPSEIQHALGQ